MPLAGITVVDLTSNVAAPFGGAILADLGASVVHVEGPTGDDCRRMAPVIGNESAYFHVVNRNKTGVRLDIRVAEDRWRLDGLLDDADVFLSNLRPGKLEKYELDADSLRARHPRLIHATLSAYGSSGLERDKPGYDAVLQARTGIASVTGTSDGPPVRAGVSILDVGAGTWLALGVLAALFRRERTGLGCDLTTSLFETGASWVAYHVAAQQVTGTPSSRHGSGHPAFSPYGIFRTGDGDICLGIGGDVLFMRLCEALDRRRLLTDERYRTNEDRVRNAASLRGELEAAMSTSSAAELAARLGEAGLPVDAVFLPEHLLDDPQAEANNVMCELPLIGHDPLIIPGLPLTFEGRRPAIRSGAPVWESDPSQR
jgi:crotonobetainyl-CoA:carnitine CoA-transferase CaiB-like acyl-CoA transferase